ncbi:MAG: sulfotransferase [DPANN group archaeon]|nr:sulfotransferase [DPANN group archaeon]
MFGLLKSFFGVSSNKEFSFTDEQKLFLKWFWKDLSRKYSSVVIYGANQHTVEMLSLIKNSSKPKITFICDNNTKKRQINGISVIKINNLKSIKSDAIIVSSETSEEYLVKKAEISSDKLEVPVIKIYNDYLSTWFSTFNKRKYRPIIPEKSYIICCTPRSGSNLLRLLLRETELAGNPKEHFGSMFKVVENGNIPYVEYLRKIKSFTSTPNKVFGTKMHWFIYEKFERFMKRTSYYKNLKGDDLLREIFPNLKYIFLTRKDKIKQAISYWKAKQTRVWVSFGNEELAYKKEPVYSFKGINECLKKIELDEEKWLAFFKDNNLSPLTIIYEDLCENFEGAIKEVLKLLEVSIPKNLKVSKPKSRILSDDLSKEWLIKFVEDCNKHNLKINS